MPRSGDTQGGECRMGEKAAYLIPETLKAVRPSLCSVRGKRHSLL